MKVLMAEDLESVRRHVQGLVREFDGFELRFVGQDGIGVLESAAEWEPDVVIIDLMLRRQLALGVLERLKRERPHTAVVVCGFFFQEYYRKGFLSHGADFFFDKSVEWDELLGFLRACQKRMPLTGAMPGRETAGVG